MIVSVKMKVLQTQLDNIHLMQDVMNRVANNEVLLKRKLLNVNSFQHRPDRDRDSYEEYPEVLQSESAVLHNCGTTCCVTGWIAVAPEFRLQGIIAGSNGAARTQVDDPLGTLMNLFGITPIEAHEIIFGSYGKEKFSQVTPKDVVAHFKVLEVKHLSKMHTLHRQEQDSE